MAFSLWTRAGDQLKSTTGQWITLKHVTSMSSTLEPAMKLGTLVSGYPFWQLSIDHNQEGVIGTRADIGEWKSDVSGHRDVTFKPAREGLKEGKQNACREKFTVQFLSNSRANHFNNNIKYQWRNFSLKTKNRLKSVDKRSYRSPHPGPAVIKKWSLSN